MRRVPANDKFLRIYYESRVAHSPTLAHLVQLFAVVLLAEMRSVATDRDASVKLLVRSTVLDVISANLACIKLN